MTYEKEIPYIKALSYSSLKKVKIISLSNMNILSIEGLMYVDV
jgi:hypothetical protein